MTLPKDKSQSRIFIDDAIDRLKQDENRKPGFQFRSGTKRFQDYSEVKTSMLSSITLRLSNYSPLAEKLMPNIKMIGTSREHTEGSTGKGNTSVLHQYARNLNAPFNSITPRFNYTKDAFKRMENPGPGSYSINIEDSIPKFDATAAFRASSRDKYSLMRNIIKSSSKNPGPGSHNNNFSSILKRSFNANLK